MLGSLEIWGVLVLCLRQRVTAVVRAPCASVEHRRGFMSKICEAIRVARYLTVLSMQPLRVAVLRYRTFVTGCVLALLIASSVRAQQGSAVLAGHVKDAATGQPIIDCVLSVTSPSLQGEEIAVTDATGAYRIPGLPPGVYVLRAEKENFRPYAREQLELHADTTIRLNASLLPEALKAQEVVVVGRTPTVDIGSSTTGMNITSDFTARIPLSPPGIKGSAARSFESIADVVPGTQPDPFGVSFFGASSPENRYLLDGLSVSNATYGVLGTPLSIDFIKEVSVLSGGYMPEYGRATGGILNAITKSGSNEYHASVFSNWSPGALEGDRKVVHREGDSIVTATALRYMGDIGGDVGGPIIRDKLWFYGGFDWAQTKYNVSRSLHRTLYDAAGNELVDSAGQPRTQLIPATTHTYYAQQDIFQGIGKLTWAANRANRLTLSGNGLFPVSGGNGKYGISPLTGLPLLGNENRLNGPYEAIAHRYQGSSINTMLKWSTELDGKRAMLDTWLGWHYESGGRLPSDGSAIGGDSGLAGISNVWWLRPGHNLTDFSQFESVPKGACDAPANNPTAVPCPVSDYHTGGPEFVDRQSMNRLQGRSVFTYLVHALGEHVFKAGADFEYQIHDGLRAYTGARDYVEYPDAPIFVDGRVYGYLTAPDQPVVLNSVHARTKSISMGGFAQDSWSIVEQLTLNLGLRYDAQLLFTNDNTLAMTLPNQWSPRAGVIYDPTGEGRAKIYTNFARYYEAVPLRMLDRYLSGEPLLVAARDPSMCNPLDPEQQHNECLRDSAVLPAAGSPPNAKYDGFSGSTSVIDPKLKPPSTDEFVFGGEYEVVNDGRLGLSYTMRRLNRTIEDMSRDEGSTFFFGNPGYGIATDFPKAQRKYDGATLYFTKLLSQGWLAQASYTVSWLRGNYSGLFRPEDLQFDPHQSADFDLSSLYVNRYGPLPGDHRHYVKVFGAKTIDIPHAGAFTPGAAFRAFSGEPTSYLGAHDAYIDNVYILPRGDGPRLPWTYSADLKLAYGFNFDHGRALSLTMDIFNLFNFQAIAARDQRYTASSVAPVTKGGLGELTNADGTAFDASSQRNPNFGKATAFQAPRVFRFGLRASF
jgi:hypothetical protein